MNLLFSCVGRRGYIADFFRPHLQSADRIIGTGNTAWTPGFQACDVSFVLPDIADDGYVPAVLGLCEREEVDAVLSFSDPDVLKLSHARAEFMDRGIVPLFPPAEVVGLATDKYRMSQFLNGHGFATPRTALRPDEACEFTYPLYVKPRDGSASHHLFLARDLRELETFFDYAPNMIIQEAVRGQELNIQLCGDLSGRPVGIGLLRKRCMRQGETDQAETFRDPVIIDFGLRLGELLGPVGPMDVDVILEGDALVVLEANTRFGGAYPCVHLAGADFPKLLLDLVRDGKVAEIDAAYAAGVVMMKRLDILGGSAEHFFRDALRVRWP